MTARPSGVSTSRQLSPHFTMVRPWPSAARAWRRSPSGTPVAGVKNVSSGGASGGSTSPSLTTARLSLPTANR